MHLVEEQRGRLAITGGSISNSSPEAAALVAAHLTECQLQLADTQMQLHDARQQLAAAQQNIERLQTELKRCGCGHPWLCLVTAVT